MTALINADFRAPQSTHIFKDENRVFSGLLHCECESISPDSQIIQFYAVPEEHARLVPFLWVLRVFDSP
jgi:hypothetical protein